MASRDWVCVCACCNEGIAVAIAGVGARYCQYSFYSTSDIATLWLPLLSLWQCTEYTHSFLLTTRQFVPIIWTFVPVSIKLILLARHFTGCGYIHTYSIIGTFIDIMVPWDGVGGPLLGR